MKLEKYEIDHLRKLRKALSECTLFLKRNNDFPLENPGYIALFGNGVRHTIKGGTGSGEVNSRFFETVEKGFKKSGFTITTENWLNAYDAILSNAKAAFVDSVKAKARAEHKLAVTASMGQIMPEPEYKLALPVNTQTAIYVLSRTSGEGSDRNAVNGDILLTRTERRDILYLNQHYEKFMLVLNVGGPVDLTPVLEVKNILLLSQLGVQTGSALADIVLGRTNPSGKLTTTWTNADGYCEIGNFGDVNETYYKEGIYVGYRYFDSVGKKPMFPFGYGLSYTDFEITKTNIFKTFDSDSEPHIHVHAEVKNTGRFAGKEVVQLYVSKPEGRLDQPYQSLAAWTKTVEILPDETQSINIEFKFSELASFDTERAAYVLESGDYILRIGNSSQSTTACGVVNVPEEITVKKVDNLMNAEGITDWKPEKPVLYEFTDHLDKISILPSDISMEEIDYNRKARILAKIAHLDNMTVARLCNGYFDPKGGIASMIGNASRSVAGAAGETHSLDEIELPPIVMADGPAGIRISKQCFIDKNGAHAVGSTMIATMEDFMPAPLKLFMNVSAPKPGKNDTVYDQYCTAIPIGTALAQSWNLELANMCGDIVGDEMERFHIHLWLAPALNIHRNIRCGRNFEYFSEDPLISGKFAAALTDGVQAHPGCGTTIKHFAGNNQETNRCFNNSNISERALREIYLKGFEICVKESQPKAVMTSYNLINGIHTSESRDLITKILRREFGFEGIVMTDWVINAMPAEAGSVHARPDAWKVAAAGGDLFMPGSKGDYKNILDALENGSLNRRQVNINLTRVYLMAKELNF